MKTEPKFESQIAQEDTANFLTLAETIGGLESCPSFIKYFLDRSLKDWSQNFVGYLLFTDFPPMGMFVN